MPDISLDGLEFCCTHRAQPEMIDYNGHLNVGYYGVLFEEGARAVFARLDISRAYRERTGRALFGIEAHTSFRKEVLQDEEVDLHFRLAGATDRALHALFLMVNRSRDVLAAAQEVLYLHVDLASRRVVSMPEAVLGRLADLRARQDAWPMPFDLGRRIELRGAKPSGSGQSTRLRI